MYAPHILGFPNARALLRAWWLLLLLLCATATLLAFPHTTEAAASISVTDQEVIDDDRAAFNPYDFTDVDVGAPDAKRYILVGVTSRYGTGTPGVLTFTINGSPATLLATVTNSSSHVTAIYGTFVPNGTTADVQITFTADAFWCRIAVARAVGIVLAPIDTASDFETGDPIGANATLDLDVDVVEGGVAFGFIGMSNVSSPTSDWSGLTDAAAQPAGEGTGGSAASLATSADHLRVGGYFGRLVISAHGRRRLL